MFIVDSLRSSLAFVEKMNFRHRPLDAEAIWQAKSIAEEYLQLTETEKKSAREAVTPAVAGKLISLSGLLAEFAVNSEGKEWINIGIVLQIVEDFNLDYRENIRRLVLLNDAAARLFMDFKSAIATLRPHMTERSAKGLLGFAERDERINNLRSFGVRAETSGGIFKYRTIDQ